MNIVQQNYFKRLKYVLDGPLGELEISEPIGWDSDNKIFKRSTEVHGVFTNLSNNLEFYRGDSENNGGYDYLKETFDIYGINAKVLLTRYEDDMAVWEIDYQGYLDFSTYVRNEHTIELKFNESGIYQKIKARRTDSFELNRTETMDGSEMPPLSDIISVANLDGRTIYFISKLTATMGQTQRIEVGWDGVQGNLVMIEPTYNRVILNHFELGTWEAICVPLTLLSEQEGSQENGHVETVRVYNIREDENGYKEFQDTTGMMFYSDSADVGEIKFGIDIDFEIPDLGWNSTSDEIRVDILKFTRQDDTSFKLEEYNTLLTLNSPGLGTKHNITLEYKDETELGTSYCLAIHTKNTNDGFVVLDFTKADILITDPSYYEASQTNFLLPFEAMERVLKVITDEDDILESSVLGRKDMTHRPDLSYEKDGFASLIGITNGFWVRLFNDKPIKTSFRDFQNSFFVMAQCGYGIEKDGFKEKVVIERLDYYYRDIVTIPINARPNNIVRKVSQDHFFSTIEIGYKYPTGDNLYEEQQGLDEYNIRNSFTSVIDRIEKTIEYISQFSTDGYGKEFARRLPITKYPERDTRYDQRIMAMDLKRGVGEIFEERKWADDFEVPSPFNKQTTGTYSPDSAVNLRLSPMNVLLRFNFWISSGLQKYPDDYLRFSESNGNSTLKTKLREDIYGPSVERAENSNIQNKDLGLSLFNPEIITFEYPVDSSMMKTIQGKTIVDGDKVLNYYGLVSFINEDNKIEYGFLLSVEPNAEGKWELLQSVRKPINFVDEREPIPLPTTQDGFDYDLDFDVN